MNEACKTTFADALQHMTVGGGIAVAAIAFAAGAAACVFFWSVFR